MQYTAFTIENYKGIKKCTIRLDKSHGINVYTLVGLNESGKTTILEAINYFIASDKDLASVYAEGPLSIPHASFVPKSRKFDFTDRVKITAYIQLDDEDIEFISNSAESTGEYRFRKETIKRNITCTQHYTFDNSEYKSEGREWTIVIPVTTKGRGKHKDLTLNHPNLIWTKTVKGLISRFPRICYFPTFLFSFPERIYIETDQSESETNYYYRRLLQDVLDSLDGDITIERHIIEKVRNPDSDVPFDWFNFFGTDKREQVNHLLLRLSSKLTEVIMTSWKRVFGNQLENKRIEVELSYDKEKDQLFLKLFIVDGSERYAVSDRSLGFRWFFCYLMFTYFRLARKGQNGIVFLFDEPASNLHAGAQMELLSTIGSLAGPNNAVIYSTHSHYLVNPRWLDSAYIVRNAAQPYDGTGLDVNTSHDTDITATRYRNFVGTSPDQSIYYLPVLDALDYRPSALEMRNPAVIVEGKIDYCLLSKVAADMGVKIDFIPANGATAADPIIGILTGWGQPFLVMLDDDEEGTGAIDVYREDWGMSPEVAFTIGDAGASSKGKSLEGVVKALAKSDIESFFEVSSIKKKHIQMYVMEAAAPGSAIVLPPALTDILKDLVALASTRLAQI